MWIRLQDQAPKIGQAVLISDGKAIYCATYAPWFRPVGHPDRNMNCWDPHGFGGSEWEWDFEENSITHWMPLPELPQ